MIDFIRQEGSQIDAQRKLLWGNRVPQRWQGRDNLGELCKDADNLEQKMVLDNLSKSLEEFYEADYRRLNWYVHGSGLAGIRKLQPDGFGYLVSLSLIDCIELGSLCTEVIMSHFNLVALRDNWDDAKLAAHLKILGVQGEENLEVY